MTLLLKNFGDILISRPSGREAFLAAKAYLLPKEDGIEEELIIDFEGVNVLAPSWADEFITPFKKFYQKTKIVYINMNNSSITETLKAI